MLNLPSFQSVKTLSNGSPRIAASTSSAVFLLTSVQVACLRLLAKTKRFAQGDSVISGVWVRAADGGLPALPKSLSPEVNIFASCVAESHHVLVVVGACSGTFRCGLNRCCSDQPPRAASGNDCRG